MVPSGTLSNNQTLRLQGSCRMSLVQPYATDMFGNRRIREVRFKCAVPIYYHFFLGLFVGGDQLRGIQAGVVKRAAVQQPPCPHDH